MTKKIIGDCACPECRANGRDKTGNHLILFVNTETEEVTTVVEDEVIVKGIAEDIAAPEAIEAPMPVAEEVQPEVATPEVPDKE